MHVREHQGSDDHQRADDGNEQNAAFPHRHFRTFPRAMFGHSALVIGIVSGALNGTCVRRRHSTRLHAWTLGAAR
jgi:hypothetical protein